MHKYGYYEFIYCLFYSPLKKSVSCRGKPEDCLMLATSIVDGVKWLVQVRTSLIYMEIVFNVKTTEGYNSDGTF